MAKRMLIDALHTEETRVVIADDNQVYDFDFVTTAKKQLKGNIYLAKITRVEPSLQAAFVEYGGGKQGFLPFSEIHTDYYQIPASDRKRLMEEAEREHAAEETGHDDAVAHDGEEQAIDATSGKEHGEEESESEQAQPFPLAPATDQEAFEQEATEPAMPEPDAPEPGTLEPGSPEAGAAEPSHEELRPAYLNEAATGNSVSVAVEPQAEDATSVEAAPLSNQPALEQPAEAAEEHGQQPIAAHDAAASEDVETLSSEEDDFQARPKKNVFLKRYKIQEVIRRGQIVLVQVIKEERGNKGVSLTTYLSLAGRYCVLMPNSPKDGGISRKIASSEDRKRLKAISTELRLARGMSVIIRTAGLDRTRTEIKRDFDYLVKLWNGIRSDTMSSTAPALIYEESDIIKRAIRDQYANDIDEVIVEGEEGYKTARDFMKLLLPSHTPKIKHHSGQTPLFYAYNIEEQLQSMHDPVVKLKSGGYLVINPTEALISVDVNSGRATGERNIEETAAKTNLEAAAEVARQLRLRDLAGLIVIDFIDMMESRNRRNVEKMLKDSLKMDRAKIQLGRISPFGLLEMSRQRLRPSISETNMVPCAHCVGRGYVRSDESMSIQVIRSIEKEASMGQWAVLRVVAPQATALHLLNYKRDALRDIEQRYGLTIAVAIGADLTASDFTIEKIRRTNSDRAERPERNERMDRSERPQRDNRPARNERIAKPVAVSVTEENEPDAIDETMDEESPLREGGDEARKTRSRRGRRGRNRRGEKPAITAAEDMTDNDNAEEMEGVSASTDITEVGETAGQPARTPRPRTDRGRRRWRDRGGRDERPRNEPADTGEAMADPANYGHEPVYVQAQAVPHEAAAQASQPTRWSEDTTIPNFAAQEPILPLPVRAHTPAPVESTPRNPNAAPKKGWWQKMIELDD